RVKRWWRRRQRQGQGRRQGQGQERRQRRRQRRRQGRQGRRRRRRQGRQGRRRRKPCRNARRFSRRGRAWEQRERIGDGDGHGDGHGRKRRSYLQSLLLCVLCVLCGALFFVLLRVRVLCGELFFVLLRVRCGALFLLPEENLSGQVSFSHLQCRAWTIHGFVSRDEAPSDSTPSSRRSSSTFGGPTIACGSSRTSSSGASD